MAAAGADRGCAAAAAVALQPCDEKVRRDIECVVCGRKNLTDAQMASLLTQYFPQTYTYDNRDLITERIAKINPLPWRKAVAVAEPAPAANKRRKMEEAPVLSRQSVASSSSVASDESSESDGSSDGEISGDLGRGDELGDGGREIVKINGDGGGRDANRSNLAKLGDLGRSDGLGDDGRETVKINGDGGRKDVNRSNLAKLGDLGGSDGRREKHNWPMFRDFHGISWVLNKLRMKLVTPLLQWKLLNHLGVKPVARILLHGAPGCGKTRLARAIANEARLPLFEISAARLVSRVSGMVAFYVELC